MLSLHDAVVGNSAFPYALPYDSAGFDPARNVKESDSISMEVNADHKTISDIQAVADSGPFLPEWESLKGFRVPAWYEDGKFGIFIHWGVYAVPAFANEWYPRNMYDPASNEFKHHVATYGTHTEFGYKDFIPMFKAERYDPAEWAALFKAAGAKFVVPVAEHHDGFAMYDSAFSEWCAAKMGPRRDLIGDLANATRDAGMVFRASSHRAERWWFMDKGRSFPSDVQDPAFESFYGPAQPGPEDLGSTTQAPPSEEYLQDWLQRTCEIVDKYQPQLLWFDWWIQQEKFEPYLRLFAAYYYNRGAQWGKQVAINFKHHAFPEGTAVFDVERGQLAGIRAEFWQTDTSVAKNSWCYTQGNEYKAVTSLVQDLVDIVSKNGALLLNVGPRADGTIPDEDQSILHEIGKWLAVNGEAIYGTRPWKIFGEGPTEIPEGQFTDTNRAAFTGQDIRFTVKGNALYATLLAWPGETATIRSLGTASGLYEGDIHSITLLGHDAPLAFSRTVDALTVSLPSNPVGEHAFVLKIH